MSQFPPEIRHFASEFLEMQLERHRADYDPVGHWRKSEVVAEIEDAKRAIESLDRVSREDQRLLAAHVLFRRRSGASAVQSAR